jgi:hypothetical protein
LSAQSSARAAQVDAISSDATAIAVRIIISSFSCRGQANGSSAGMPTGTSPR